MKYVFCSLNDIDFSDKRDNDQLEKLRCVKRLLVTEFEDYIVSKLVYVLNIVDKTLIFK